MIVANGTARYSCLLEAAIYAFDDYVVAWGAWAELHPRAAAATMAVKFAACVVLVGLIEGMS